MVREGKSIASFRSFARVERRLCCWSWNFGCIWMALLDWRCIVCRHAHLSALYCQTARHKKSKPGVYDGKWHCECCLCCFRYRRPFHSLLTETCWHAFLQLIMDVKELVLLSPIH